MDHLAATPQSLLNILEGTTSVADGYNTHRRTEAPDPQLGLCTKAAAVKDRRSQTLAGVTLRHGRLRPTHMLSLHCSTPNQYWIVPSPSLAASTRFLRSRMMVLSHASPVSTIAVSPLDICVAAPAPPQRYPMYKSVTAMATGG